MRKALLLLPLLALATPASAIFIDFTGGGVVWDSSAPLGWTSPEPLAEIRGDEALGEFVEDVSANCATVSWAQAGVATVSRNGTKWTATVYGRGYNTGVAKQDDCSIFIDFAGGGVFDLPVEFD